MEHPANRAPLADALLDPSLRPLLFPERSASFYPIRGVYNALAHMRVLDNPLIRN